MKELLIGLWALASVVTWVLSPFPWFVTVAVVFVAWALVAAYLIRIEERNM